MKAVFGRTNVSFPDLWWSLRLPDRSSPEEARRLVDAVVQAGGPVDVSAGTSVWGPALGSATVPILAVLGREVEDAPDAETASRLVTGSLIAALSCLGRPQLDFAVLPVRRALEEFQVDGALSALESARQDGLIRFLGLACRGPGLVALGLWQFRDAFDVVIVPARGLHGDAYDILEPLARQRRVGIVAQLAGPDAPFDRPGPWLVPVSSAGQVESVARRAAGGS